MGKTWFIPHHGVYHPHKPGKIRVVFDCSAKYKGKSLNDLLLKGPDLTNSLLGVLTRFRQEHVAVMADIQAMFHQVKVPDTDRSFLRFLWWPKGDLSYALKEYQMSVDDCLKSLPSVQDAIAHVGDFRSLLQRGGFRLMKWISSDREVLETIPEPERTQTIKEISLQHAVERALGVQWRVNTDTFGFDVNVKERPPMRRGILSIIGSVFDPFGFAAPFVLTAKKILQDLCKMKLGWYEKILPEYNVRWQKWLVDLPMLSKLPINRCFKLANFGTIAYSQLHHFSDASEIGFGSVSYLGLVDINGRVHCAILQGKSRLAPLKKFTIPQLELSAATVSVRSDKAIKRELELPLTEPSVFWTDSTSVLRYVNNEDKRFHTFLANRIAIIRDGSLISGHSSREYVLSLLRERFWVIKGSSAVRRILSKCVSCRRRQAPVLEQKMADLPEDRLTPDQPPFTAVGVDCFGPFHIRLPRSLAKQYGVIFTCLAICTVHIEVVHSLETDSFLLALGRFKARRGQVKEIRSDSGTNFTAGERELRRSIRVWNQERIHESLLQKDIKWTINPPYGSHHGGIW